jgi:hypothetical protein
MIWFNLKEMERKISTNDISEKESVNYYLAIFIISTIYAMIVAVLKKSPIDSQGFSVTIQYFLDGLILVVGVLFSYKLNSNIDNKDFFKRFFSLSFVIFIRLTIYTFCFGIFILIFLSLFINFNDLNNSLISYLSHVWKIVFYTLIALSFQRIHRLNQSNYNNGN